MQVLLGVLVTWLVCHVLTVTNALPNDPETWGHAARTDIYSDALGDAPWFYLPNPGQLRG